MSHADPIVVGVRRQCQLSGVEKEVNMLEELDEYVVACDQVGAYPDG